MLAIRRQLILAAASPWNKGRWKRVTGKVSSLQEENSFADHHLPDFQHKP